MGGDLERTAGDGFPHKYEVGNSPCLRPLVYWISEILSIIINVHSVPTVLFTGLRGSDNCKLLSGEKEILVKKDHSENFSRQIWLESHMIFWSPQTRAKSPPMSITKYKLLLSGVQNTK